MRVVLAGAFGHLGTEILKELCKRGDTEVIAAGRKERPVPGLEGKYKFVRINAIKPDSLYGLMKGCDVLISTIGLTGASTEVNCYDIDYDGNINLIAEANEAGVKKINYVSVIACDHPDAAKIPMLHAKYLVEEELKKGPADYVIYRPTGYFYDIAKVFAPYVEKGEMQLLAGYGGVKANVVDCPDFARFIVDHMLDTNKTYEVGGKETYSYREMAEMCLKAAGKKVKIKYAPRFLFGILARLPKIKAEGKQDVIRFSQFTLSHDLVGKDIAGDASFKEYIQQRFGGGRG